MEDRRPGAPTDVVPSARQPVVSGEPGVLPDPGPRPPMIERQQLVVIGAVLFVLLLMVVTLAVLWPAPPDAEGPRADRPAGDQTAPADGDESLSDLERVDPDQARRLLLGSGISVKGTVQSGWTWSDHNGFNLATTSISQRGPAREPTDATLTISHVANLNGRPRQLRLLRDPVTCEHRGRLRAGFTPGSFRVSDLNGDGIAEVTVGWWFNCDENLPDGTAVKLALLSDGDKFIRRGTGPGPAPERSTPGAEAGPGPDREATDNGAPAPKRGPGQDAAGQNEGPGQGEGRGPDQGSAQGPGQDSPPNGPQERAGDERIIAPLESFRSEPPEARWPREFWDRSQDLLTSLHGIGD